MQQKDINKILPEIKNYPAIATLEFNKFTKNRITQAVNFTNTVTYLYNYAYLFEFFSLDALYRFLKQ